MTTLETQHLLPPLANALVIFRPSVPFGEEPDPKPENTWLVKVNHRSTAIPSSPEYYEAGRAYLCAWGCESIDDAEELAAEYWERVKSPQTLTVRATFIAELEENGG